MQPLKITGIEKWLLTEKLASMSQLPAFEVDNRIRLKIERELAAFIGGLILESNTDNKAAIALGHQLQRLSEPDKKSDDKINS